MKWLSILAALLGAATALRSDIPEHRLGIEHCDDFYMYSDFINKISS
jgi:hypothetical protein